MAKHNPEIPAFPMVVTLKGLEHNTPWVQEMFSEQLAVGGEVEVRIARRRSLPQLRHYWGLLNLCVANSENKYGRSEDLHDALKVALGYKRTVRNVVTGEIMVFPGSIAFGRMTQGDFNIYYDRAKAELAKAGYPVEAYLKEVDKSMASYKRPYQGKQVTGDSRGAEHKEAA